MVLYCLCCDCCFFFKQKTAYEMRISDWSSDVCSSDLAGRRGNVLANFGSMKRLSFLAAINASGGLQRQVSAVALRNELRPANISPGIVLFLNDSDRCLRIGQGGVVMGTLFDRRDGDRHVQRLGDRSEEHTSELQSLMRT